jgi:hypothetical protein
VLDLHCFILYKQCKSSNIRLRIFEKSKHCLDFKNKKLHFDPRRQLVLENEINVPPKSEIIVVAKLKGESLPNDQYQTILYFYLLYRLT